MPTLLEIEQTIDALLSAHDDTIEQAGTEQERAELEAHLVTELELLAKSEADKIDAYGALVNRCETEAERYGKIIDNLSERRRVMNARADRAKKFLLGTFQFCGRKKVEGAVYVARLRNTESVEIESENLIPAQYNRIKIEPDKKAIKEAIKAGEEIPGATLIEKTSISIGTK